MENIIFAGGNKKIKLKSKEISLKEFSDKRNKVLILRDTGGLGDILMMRMIFKDFKELMPDAHISFAIPTNYHKAALWHPYIDEVLDSKTVDENDFGISYNLTTPCVRYEIKIRPYADRHRAEIWSSYCNVKLKNTNMYLNVPDDIINDVKYKLEKLIPRNKGYVCFSPISNMISKDLNEDQIKQILIGIRERGYSPYILHNKSINYVDCPVIECPLDQWLALVSIADCVITVDTAVFHAANGFMKPTVAIFSWADGKVYSKFHPKCLLIQKHRDHTPGWECGPCYNHINCPKTKDDRKPCMTEITSNEILETFSSLLEKYHL